MNPTILPLQKYLDALYEKYRGLTAGAVANYIPELAKADPDAFGICIVTADGYVYEIGDYDREFDTIHHSIGVEGFCVRAGA